MTPLLAASLVPGLVQTGLEKLEGVLEKVKQASAQPQDKLRETAEDFESVFLNAMLGQMFSGLQGEGPFGTEGHNEAWRGMLTEEYSKNIVKAGGVGIADHVYREMLALQEARS